MDLSLKHSQLIGHLFVHHNFFATTFLFFMCFQSTFHTSQGKNITEQNRKCTTGQCGKCPGKRRQERDTKESFFLWFENEASFDENQMVDDLRNVFQHPFAFIGQEDEEPNEDGTEGAVSAEQRRADDEEDEEEEEGEFAVESDNTGMGMPEGDDEYDDEEGGDDNGENEEGDPDDGGNGDD